RHGRMRCNSPTLVRRLALAGLVAAGRLLRLHVLGIAFGRFRLWSRRPAGLAVAIVITLAAEWLPLRGRGVLDVAGTRTVRRIGDLAAVLVDELAVVAHLDLARVAGRPVFHDVP